MANRLSMVIAPRRQPAAPSRRSEDSRHNLLRDPAKVNKMLHDLLDEAGVWSYRIQSESGKGWCIYSVDQSHSGEWKTFCFLVTERMLLNVEVNESARRALLISLAMNLTVRPG